MGDQVHCTCGRTLTLEVLRSFAGYYLGYFCEGGEADGEHDECCGGPWDRVSGYYKSREKAEQALADL